MDFVVGLLRLLVPGALMYKWMKGRGRIGESREGVSANTVVGRSGVQFSLEMERVQDDEAGESEVLVENESSSGEISPDSWFSNRTRQVGVSPVTSLLSRSIRRS